MAKRYKTTGVPGKIKTIRMLNKMIKESRKNVNDYMKMGWISEAHEEKRRLIDLIRYRDWVKREL